MVTVNNAQGRQFFPRATVFDGGAPIAWTDLDLSAWVGRRRADVYITCNNGTGAGINYCCRRNGDARDFYVGVCAQRTTTIATGYSTTLECQTDENGIIEWFANANTAGSVLVLEAFTVQ